MTNVINRLIGSKKEYRINKARVEALPKDYQFVFNKITKYIWSFCGGSGTDMLKTQYDLIDLFESAAAEGRHVLEVTGEDVASFCDELIKNDTKWMDYYRKRLNLKFNKMK